MVSAVLVIVLALATLSVIDKSGAASATTRMRGTATGLAQEDQDQMRVMSIAQLDRRDTTYPKAVAGVTFSIHSVAQWVRDSGRATCDSATDRVEYLKTTTYVTWPGHTDDPVTLESYISPGVEAIAKGSLMVKLHTDPGVGVPDQTVTLSTGQSGNTDQTGCVLFTGLDAGNVNVSWNGTQGDYVDRNGIQTPSEAVVIGAGQTAQLDRLWDRAGRATIRWVDENGQGIVPNTPGTPAAPSGGIGAAFVSSFITKPTYPALLQTRFFDNQTDVVAANTPLDPHIPVVTTANATTKVGELFPYTAPYTVASGGCLANNPLTYNSAFREPNVVVPAGGDSAQVDVLVPFATVTLTGAPSTARGATGGSLTYVKLINQDSNRFCVDSTPIDTTASASPYTFRVPAGVYNVCVQKAVGSTRYAATAVASVTPGSSTAGRNAATVNVTGIGEGTATNQWKPGATC